MTTFYCHFNKEEDRIHKVSPQETPDDASDTNIIIFSIPEETALKILSGETNITQWILGIEDDGLDLKYTLQWNTQKKTVISRVDSSFLFELEQNKLSRLSDVHCILDKENKTFEVMINRRHASQREKISVFLTGKNDPSFVYHSYIISPEDLKEKIEYISDSVAHLSWVFTLDVMREYSIFSTKNFKAMSMEIR